MLVMANTNIHDTHLEAPEILRGATSSKPQAPSHKLQAPSRKLQATSGPEARPRPGVGNRRPPQAGVGNKYPAPTPTTCQVYRIF